MEDLTPADVMTELFTALTAQLYCRTHKYIQGSIYDLTLAQWS